MDGFAKSYTMGTLLSMKEPENPPMARAASIVVLGAFNPAIIQPWWLAKLDLISDSEAKASQTQAITREISLFETGWFKLQCLEDRLQVETTDEGRFPDVRDLAVNICRVLEHTPIHAFGFNSSVHVMMANIETWHNFGNECTPKQLWEKYLKKPGMRTLVIEGARKDSAAAYAQIKVEPSRQIENGVLIHFNEHYRLDKIESPFDRIREFVRLGEGVFLEFQNYADEVAKDIMSLYIHKE